MKMAELTINPLGDSDAPFLPVPRRDVIRRRPVVPTSIFDSEQTVTSTPIYEPPTLQDFAASVVNGVSHQLRGVHVSRKLAFPVEEQTNIYEVKPGRVFTRFKVFDGYRHRWADDSWLLTEADYTETITRRLAVGDVVSAVYGDGATRSFQLQNILHFQVNDPFNAYSDLQQITPAGEPITAWLTPRDTIPILRDEDQVDNELLIQTCGYSGKIDINQRLVPDMRIFYRSRAE